MRLIAITLLSAIVASASAAGTPSQPIDLNRPGALEQLKRDRPKHYEAISEVLRVVERVPCKDREIHTLSVKFDIRDLACYSMLMTSAPPKRRLAFQLEGTSYVAVVTVKGTEGRATPAKKND